MKNSRANARENHCDSTGDEVPLKGSAMVANDRPMPTLTSSPARRPASKARRSIIPIATPSENSRSTPSTVAASTPIGGGAGITVAKAADSARVVISRARAGMPRPPTTGSTCSAAPTRSAYHSTAPSMANRSSPASVVSETVSTAASADQVRDAVEQVDGERDHAPEQEVAGGGQHHHQAQGLDHELDGRFVDLGGGLQHADRHAQHQHRDQGRPAQGQRHLQAAGDLAECGFRSHRARLTAG